jgi:putative proteasome-type protease
VTYCVAAMLKQGLLFASDTRTNAGVDHVGSFCKMRIYQRQGDRVVVMLSAGNLATTQAMVHLLDNQDWADTEHPTIWNTTRMYDVAQRIGDALRSVQNRDGPYLSQHSIDYGASILVGGQIAGEPCRLFNIYPQGNFIEASPDTLYFQIGEVKYGKPILDRVLTWETPLSDAAKCTLISFDSTVRSNISVGLPIDLAIYHRDSLSLAPPRRICENDPYYSELRAGWGQGLRGVFSGLPNPDWVPIRPDAGSAA